MIFSYIYLGVGLFIFAVATLVAGYRRVKSTAISYEKDEETFNIIMGSFMGAIGWPFIILLGALLSPFVGLFYLGKFIATK